MTQGQLCTVINEYLPSDLKDGNGTIDKYYRFGIKYLKSIFRVRMFPKVKVVMGTGGLNYQDLEGKDVVISVTETKPTGSAHFSYGDETITRNTFEARVILSMTVELDDFHEHQDDEAKTNWKFTGTRHSRHGGGKRGFRNWWQQERSPKAKNIMTKVNTPTDDNDTYPHLPSRATYYVVVYVRLEEVEVENYKLDLHRSVGGQCTVFCNCNGRQNPLIVSGMMDQERRKCMSQSCKKCENYMCPVKDCKTRLCFKCLETKSASLKPHIISPSLVPLGSREPGGGTKMSHQEGDTIVEESEQHAAHSEEVTDGIAFEANDEGDEGDSSDEDDGGLETHQYDYGIPESNDAEYCDDGDEDFCRSGEDGDVGVGEGEVLEDISRDPDEEEFTEEDMVLPMSEDDTSDMDYCNDDKVGGGECDHVWDEECKKERDEEAFCELFPIPEEEELANEGPRAINFIGVPPGYYEDTDEPFQVSDNGSPSADVHKHGAPPSGCSDPVGKSTLTPRNFEDSCGL